MNGSERTPAAVARTSRAKRGIPASPTAKTTLINPGPSNATMVNASSKLGKASSTSTMRIRKDSDLPPE